MNIDTAALGRDLASVATACATLKRVLRARWERSMAGEQRQLVRLRRRATELCVLRAYARGKYHLKGPMRDGSYPGVAWDSEKFHATIASRVAKDYPPAKSADDAAAASVGAS